MSLRELLLVPVLLTAAGCGTGPPSIDLTPEPTPAESVSSTGFSGEAAKAIEYAAIDYAAATGVDIAEARRRAKLLEDARPTLDSIRRESGDTRAGLYIEHKPDLRVYLRLTTSPSPALQALIDESRVPIVVTIDAALSFSESRRRLERATPELARTVPELMGTGIDERTGEAVMNVFVHGAPEEVAEAKSRIEQAAASLGRQIGLPVRIEYLPGPLLDADLSADR